MMTDWVNYWVVMNQTHGVITTQSDKVNLVICKLGEK